MASLGCLLNKCTLFCRSHRHIVSYACRALHITRCCITLVVVVVTDTYSLGLGYCIYFKRWRKCCQLWDGYFFFFCALLRCVHLADLASASLPMQHVRSACVIGKQGCTSSASITKKPWCAGAIDGCCLVITTTCGEGLQTKKCHPFPFLPSWQREHERSSAQIMHGKCAAGVGWQSLGDTSPSHGRAPQQAESILLSSIHHPPPSELGLHSFSERNEGRRGV